MASSSHSYNSPCAACKFLRRKCMPGCIFAPYFPPEEPQKFINVHKIFGASNVTKLLNELLPHQREDAVNSLAYEAEARVQDPVYGCVGAISYLQRQVERLQKELDAANADLIRYACSEIQTSMHLPVPGHVPASVSLPVPVPSLLPMNEVHNPMTPRMARSPVELINNARRVSNQEMGGVGFFQAPPHFQFPYSPHLWSENPNGSKGGEGNI